MPLDCRTFPIPEGLDWKVLRWVQVGGKGAHRASRGFTNLRTKENFNSAKTLVHWHQLRGDLFIERLSFSFSVSQPKGARHSRKQWEGGALGIAESKKPFPVCGGWADTVVAQKHKEDRQLRQQIKWHRLLLHPWTIRGPSVLFACYIFFMPVKNWHLKCYSKSEVKFAL